MSGVVHYQSRYSKDRKVVELCPFRKTFGFDLVSDGDKGKVDSMAMNYSFYQSEGATDTVQLDQFW